MVAALFGVGALVVQNAPPGVGCQGALGTGLHQQGTAKAQAGQSPATSPSRPSPTRCPPSAKPARCRPAATFTPDNGNGHGDDCRPDAVGRRHPYTIDLQAANTTTQPNTTDQTLTLTVTSKLPLIRHVFVIMLENNDYSATFGNPSADPYLATTLPV